MHTKPVTIDAIYNGTRKKGLMLDPDERLDKIALELMQLFGLTGTVSLWQMNLSGCRLLNLDDRVDQTELRSGSVIMVAPEPEQEHRKGAMIA